MRKILISFLILSGTCQWIIAQVTDKTAPAPVQRIVLDVQESKDKMSMGVQPCLKVYIPEVAKEDVERDLAKYMKSYSSKGDAKKTETFFDNAQIKAFGNNLVDIYTITEQKAGGVELKVFFDLGGAFLSSGNHPEQFKAAEDIVRRFAREEAVAGVGLQIVAAQKTLDLKMKEFDNLVRQDTALSRKIRESQAIIDQAVIDQQAIRQSQDTKKTDLEMQQELLQGLKAKQAGIE